MRADAIPRTTSSGELSAQRPLAEHAPLAMKHKDSLRRTRRAAGVIVLQLVLLKIALAVVSSLMGPISLCALAARMISMSL